MSGRRAELGPTSGAVAELNEKGELRMVKVKVNRYTSGKRPSYAQVNKEKEVCLCTVRC